MGKKRELLPRNLSNYRSLKSLCLVHLRSVFAQFKSASTFVYAFLLIVLCLDTGAFRFYCIHTGWICRKGEREISPAAWKAKGNWVHIFFPCEADIR